jgi:Mrp family chromosome partitioning ATPase
VFACSPARCWAPWSRLPAVHSAANQRAHPRAADLRKPGVGRLLNLGSGKYAGLSSYLAGISSLDLVTVQHPAIPTGPLPLNPADLLSSHKLADAIAELRGKFKFVVIDSPPIMAATDAVILSVQVDGVLLVVRSGETPKEAFTRTRDLLVSVKCHLSVWY